VDHGGRGCFGEINVDVLLTGVYKGTNVVDPLIDDGERGLSPR
jgi:hypothetical protein